MALLCKKMVLKQSLIHAYEKYQKTVFLFTSFKKVGQILTKPSSYNHRQSIEKNYIIHVQFLPKLSQIQNISYILT